MLPNTLAYPHCLNTFSNVGALHLCLFPAIFQHQNILKVNLPFPTTNGMSQENHQQETSLENENVCSEPQQQFSQPALHREEPAPSFQNFTVQSREMALSQNERETRGCLNSVTGNPFR